MERLLTLMHAGGSTVKKDEIVRALHGLSQRGIAQFNSARRWQLRTPNSLNTRAEEWSATPSTGETLHAIPAATMVGEPSAPDASLPVGALTPDLNLLQRLLPYYQAALRAGDGGAPIESLDKFGQTFTLLCPDGPWWPTSGQGSILHVPRERLPGRLQETLAKYIGGKLLIGYR